MSLTDAERDAMVAVVRAHVAAEAIADVDATLATLDDDAAYELQPMGVVLRGLDVARRYYEHLFATCRPRITGRELRAEWISDHGVAQEYVLDVDHPDGAHIRHSLVAIFDFGTDGKLSGERIYAGDTLIRFMFGPVLPGAVRG